MFSTLRPSILCVHHLRRWLATEAALPTIPVDSSPGFLEEERRRFGKLPERPTESEAEQRKMFDEFLEKKVLEKPERPQLGIKVSENHGLWAFFRQVQVRGKEVYETVEERVPGKTDSHGRAWNSFELRRKSFKDLHTLWYILLRERNLLATQKAEATRLGIQGNVLATVDRDQKVRKSMARIKQVINERRIAYLGAQALQQGKSVAEAQAIAKGMPMPVEDGMPLHVTDKQAIELTRGRGRRRGPSAATIYRANAFKEVQAKAGSGVEDTSEGVDVSAVAPEATVKVEQVKV